MEFYLQHYQSIGGDAREESCLLDRALLAVDERQLGRLRREQWPAAK
jgi:hypothetical protein